MKLAIRNRSCIHSEPGMQLLLSGSCASSSFYGVNEIFIIALYQLQMLKARRVLINMITVTWLRRPSCDPRAVRKPR